MFFILTMNLIIAICATVVLSQQTTSSVVTNKRLSLFSYRDGSGLANPPIELIGFKKNGRMFQPGEIIQGTDRWLDDLEIHFRNNYHLTITHIHFTINFTQEARQGRPIVPVTIGWVGVDNSFPGVSPTVKIKPTETASCQINRRNVDLLREVAARNSIELLDHFIITVGKIVYEGDVIWRKGYFHKPDPSMPGKWDAIRPEQKVGILIREFKTVPASFSLIERKTGGTKATNTCGYYRGFQGFDQCGHYGVFPCYMDRDSFEFFGLGPDFANFTDGYCYNIGDGTCCGDTPSSCFTNTYWAEEGGCS
jgi:hypothetical protein